MSKCYFCDSEAQEVNRVTIETYNTLKTGLLCIKHTQVFTEFFDYQKRYNDKNKKNIEGIKNENKEKKNQKRK